MRNVSKFFALLIVLFGLTTPVVMTGCAHKDAGDHMEDAADDVKDAAEDVGESIGDAAEEVGDEIKDATNE